MLMLERSSMGVLMLLMLLLYFTRVCDHFHAANETANGACMFNAREQENWYVLRLRKKKAFFFNLNNYTSNAVKTHNRM